MSVAGRLLSLVSQVMLDRVLTNHKVEAKRVVGRRGAAVRAPVQTCWAPGIAPGSELGKGDSEEKFVGDGLETLTRLSAAWYSGRAGDEAKERRDELHNCSMIV